MFFEWRRERTCRRILTYTDIGKSSGQMPCLCLGFFQKGFFTMPQQFTNQAQLSYQNTVVVSNTVTGEIADVLAMNKTVIEDAYTVGGRLTYVVNLINSGSVALSDLTLSDDLGAGSGTTVPLTYVEGSAHYFINGIPQPDPAVTTETGLTISPVTVPAGGNTTVIYDVCANEFASPEVGATLTNTVTASGDGTVPVTAAATVDVNEAPHLAITKSLSPVTVTGSGTVTYSFLIENTGNLAAGEADNLVLTDVFAPALSGIAVTYQGAPMPASGYSYDEGTGAFMTTAGALSVPAATFVQNEDGTWSTTPGSITLTITGTI